MTGLIREHATLAPSSRKLNWACVAVVSHLAGRCWRSLQKEHGEDESEATRAGARSMPAEVRPAPALVAAAPGAAAPASPGSQPLTNPNEVQQAIADLENITPSVLDEALMGAHLRLCGYGGSGADSREVAGELATDSAQF